MTDSLELPVEAEDGHRYQLLARIPQHPVAALLWLPALGVAAKHYLPFADALAARGIAVFLHEWRGAGSSSLRADRQANWDYRTLLTTDIPASERAAGAAVPTLPRIIGGHSLGGQLASCRLGLAPTSADTLWLVASGAPFWRAFPVPTRYWLPLAYRILPGLARVFGALPGRRIGFGGQEARGVMSDWAATALDGRYAAPGLDQDLETAMARARPQIRAVVLTRDWLAPESSLRFLLDKMPGAKSTIIPIGTEELGADADHFQWMKHPGAVVDALLAPEAVSGT